MTMGSSHPLACSYVAVCSDPPAPAAFTLDFHGRVKEASVKNFQLVHWDHNTDRRGADLMLQVREGVGEVAWAGR
jgi:hypothetical protein